MVSLTTEGMFSVGIDSVTDVPYLHGLDKAREILNLGLKRGYPLVVKGDPDVDGLLAYAVASSMLNQVGLPFYACVNRDRRHGIIKEELVKRDTRSWGAKKYIPTEWHQNEVIINLDSSIAGHEMQMLVDNGCYVVSLDHHELELQGYDSTKQVFTSTVSDGVGIIINNQYDFEPVENRFWSGTGVTLHALSYILGIPVKREWVAMHGITLLSDVRDIENDLAKEILAVTYKTPLIEMPTLNKLSKATQEEVPKIFKREPYYLDRTFVDYSFSPYYNASYQLNLTDILFMLIDIEDFYIHPQSKTIRRKIVSSLKDCVQRFELEHVLILHVDEDNLPDFSDLKNFDFSYTSFLGLIANSSLKDKSVFIYATSGSSWRRGSVRGYHKDVNYNVIFGENGFEVKGHKGAFGVTNVLSPVDFNKINKAIEVEEAKFSDTSNENITYSKDLLEDRLLLMELAEANEYLLSQNFHKIKYTGFGYTVYNTTKSKIAYDVSGMYVDSFNQELNPDNAYIIPTMIEGNLVLTLRV